EQQQEQQEKEVNLLVKVYHARPRQLVLSVVTFVLIATFALTGFLLAKGDTLTPLDAFCCKSKELEDIWTTSLPAKKWDSHITSSSCSSLFCMQL
ncbi:hypothetical protein Tco_0315328, partial [Tanacetum coccineum]